MVEIKEEQGEIEISKSHLRHINFYKMYILLCMLLFSFITLKLMGIFFNPLTILFIIGYIYLMLFTVSNEKIIVREDYLLIQALRNNKKVLYSKKIFLNEIEKIYFKDTFGISLILDLGIINYLINSRQKFIKIETDKKVYSYGLFIEYNDFLKIDLILQAKIKEYKDKEILANEVKRKKEELLDIYNLGIEERYKKILNTILDEEKLFLSRKDDCYIIDVVSEIRKDLEEIDFYIFYVNYLSKKEYENKKVLVGYNGSDEKEVTITKLKEDINEIRDNRSTFKKIKLHS
ncbi:hypothetical protein KST80_10710 [Fusobacterium polymorphum]|nr:hypothetical protein [Fusobacterium polymorphum]